MESCQRSFGNVWKKKNKKLGTKRNLQKRLAAKMMSKIEAKSWCQAKNRRKLPGASVKKKTHKKMYTYLSIFVTVDLHNLLVTSNYFTWRILLITSARLIS